MIGKERSRKEGKGSKKGRLNLVNIATPQTSDA